MNIFDCIEKLDYSDVLIVPNNSEMASRAEPVVTRDFIGNWERPTLHGVPLIGANMDTVGTFNMARVLDDMGCFTALHKHYSIDSYVDFYKTYPKVVERCFFTIGASDAEFKRLEIMVANKATPSLVCIDIANGYSRIMVECILKVRALLPSAIIMAGNVVTGPRAAELADAGADIIKVGIGPGSACTTRQMTGVGFPQLSAVHEVATYLLREGYDKTLVCADGGCNNPGDISKALIVGADFVMLGGMLAGHLESEGKVINSTRHLRSDVMLDENGGLIFDGNYYMTAHLLPEDAWVEEPSAFPKMEFYGMSSDTAMRKYHGGVAKYRASEGRTVYIPYRGKVRDTLQSTIGGIRSTMTYVGCEDIAKMYHCAELIKVNRQLNTVFAL